MTLPPSLVFLLALPLSGENQRFFCWGVEGRTKVAICGRADKFDCSARLPTSSTKQLSRDDVGNCNGNEVAGNKEGNGEGGKGNGDGDEGDGQATAKHGRWQWQRGWRATKRVMTRAARGVSTMMKRAMATATTWVIATAKRVEGNEEGDGKEKGEGSIGNGDGNEGGGQKRGQWQGR